jgi:hypothetical protein
VPRAFRTNDRIGGRDVWGEDNGAHDAGTRQIRVHGEPIEVRVIQNVEDFAPELQFEFPRGPTPNPKIQRAVERSSLQEMPLSADEDTSFFFGMVKPQPGDISIVDKAGTFLLWYDTFYLSALTCWVARHTLLRAWGEEGTLCLGPRRNPSANFWQSGRLAIKKPCGL